MIRRRIKEEATLNGTIIMIERRIMGVPPPTRGEIREEEEETMRGIIDLLSIILIILSQPLTKVNPKGKVDERRREKFLLLRNLETPFAPQREGRSLRVILGV